MVVKAIYWCNEKCICQEQNRKVYCRNVNRNDVSRQPEITKVILLSKSFVGLGWLTTVFKSLDLLFVLVHNVYCVLSFC